MNQPVRRLPSRTAVLRPAATRGGRSLALTRLVVLVALLNAGCGKKGPPLPPIVRVPAAPAAFLAERRGDTVAIRFDVPTSNVDGTRPANIQRVEVYGYSSTVPPVGAEIVREGTRIGSIDVKRPRDPSRVIGPDESESDLEPLLDTGVDQGATVHVTEDLSAEILVTADALSSGLGGAESPPSATGGRLTRGYVAVSISTRGRRGPLSQSTAVPLVQAPDPPSRPTVTYNEEGITVAWTPGGNATLLGPAPGGAAAQPTSEYHVYETAQESETRLTTMPLAASPFVDQRVEWGRERCYTLRILQVSNGLALQSAPSPSSCVTLTDTFPPEVPSGLLAVASEGSINLIWDENDEGDLSGYLVLRRAGATGPLLPITSVPITVTRFTDSVESEGLYEYAVQAVDSAGNASAPSETVAETAR